jgi:hypothetical protein
MRPALIQFILLTEVHQQLSRLLKRQFKAHEMRNELTHGIEDDVLSKYFRNAHCWRFLFRLRRCLFGFLVSAKEATFDLASKVSCKSLADS